MKISEYINKKTVSEIKFNFNDTDFEIFVKPLMAGSKNEMMSDVGVLININKKVTKAKKDKEEYELTAEEILASTRYRQKQAFHLMCDEKGKSEYESYEDMTSSIPADLLDEICVQIEKHLAPEKSEDIEGN